MFYIVQENTFHEENHGNLLDAINGLGLSYEIVKSRPFTDEIEFLTTRTDVFVFGSVKLAKTALSYNWKPGYLLNENHDYSVYSKEYKHNLLNFDSHLLPWVEIH